MQKNSINFFFLLLFLFGCAQQQSLDINEQEVRDSIALSQEWFVNNQYDNGLFVYYYYPPNASSDGKDNIIRQVGSFYGLISTLEFEPSVQAEETIREFHLAMQRSTHYDTIEGYDIAYVEFENVSVLNTNALYLLSLVEMQRQGLELTARDYDDMRKLANGMMLMGADQGGLWYLYYVPKKYNRISPYGTGEALFALQAYYNSVEQDPRILNFTQWHFQKHFEFSQSTGFMEEPARAFYTWAIYYLSELDKQVPGQYKSMEKLVAKMLAYRQTIPECRDQPCINVPTVWESAFFEGTVVAYRYVQNQSMKQELQQYLEPTTQLYLDSLIVSDERYTKITGEKHQGPKSNIVGGYCDAPTWCDLMRNDRNQHTLLGMIHLIK